MPNSADRGAESLSCGGRKGLQRMCNELSPTCIWPRNTLHLLGLLQDGFAPRLHLLPTTISEHIDCLVMYASKSPSCIDRKWAMEVAGCATQSPLIALLREASSSGSYWLGGVAYKQASHLRAVPDDVAHWIRQSLLDSARTGFQLPTTSTPEAATPLFAK